MERWETFEQGQPRAPRYSLKLPLRYREQGKDGWEEGSMCNISRSGLLFTAQRLHPLNSRIELTFVLPTVIPYEPPANVRCEGDTVRALSATESNAAAIAIRIVDYDLTRSES